MLRSEVSSIFVCWSMWISVGRSTVASGVPPLSGLDRVERITRWCFFPAVRVSRVFLEGFLKVWRRVRRRQ